MFYDRNLQYCCIMNHRHFLLLIGSVYAFSGRHSISDLYLSISEKPFQWLFKSHFTDGDKRWESIWPLLSLQSLYRNFRKWQEFVNSVFSGHMAKSMSFHSTSSKAATTARISTFTESLSAPKLSVFLLPTEYLRWLVFCILSFWNYKLFEIPPGFTLCIWIW